jgi:hypothetical protein
MAIYAGFPAPVLPDDINLPLCPVAEWLVGFPENRTVVFPSNAAGDTIGAAAKARG